MSILIDKFFLKAAKPLFFGAFEILLLVYLISLAQINSYKSSPQVWTFPTLTMDIVMWMLIQSSNMH